MQRGHFSNPASSVCGSKLQPLRVVSCELVAIAFAFLFTFFTLLYASPTRLRYNFALDILFRHILLSFPSGVFTSYRSFHLHTSLSIAHACPQPRRFRLTKILTCYAQSSSMTASSCMLCIKRLKSLPLRARMSRWSLSHFHLPFRFVDGRDPLYTPRSSVPFL